MSRPSLENSYSRSWMDGWMDVYQNAHVSILSHKPDIPTTGRLIKLIGDFPACRASLATFLSSSFTQALQRPRLSSDNRHTCTDETWDDGGLLLTGTSVPPQAISHYQQLLPRFPSHCTRVHSCILHTHTALSSFFWETTNRTCLSA